jgi:spore germination cell wall hydrolase CwlJ-like protein
LLARLIFCEAGLEPFMGMLGVGNVVTNRMDDKGYSLEQVIFSPGQFDGIYTPQFNMVNVDCIRAAELILKGYRFLPKQIIYYSNECLATDTTHQNTVEPHRYIDIGNHTFYWNPKDIRCTNSTP